MDLFCLENMSTKFSATEKWCFFFHFLIDYLYKLSIFINGWIGWDMRLYVAYGEYGWTAKYNWVILFLECDLS